MISGFTFIHNGVHGGYPFVEAIRAVLPFVDEMVAVDMESTDETRSVLSKIPGISILNGEWKPGAAGECLKKAHAMFRFCQHETIWHFEADEVIDSRMAFDVQNAIFHDGVTDVLMRRLQVEQNFQRCRWYPELVHRVFQKDIAVEKDGHTTNIHNDPGTGMVAYVPKTGFLWDVTNCFRDDWLNRVRQQQELWGNNEDTHTLYVPLHANHCNLMPLNCVDEFLNEEHWTWKLSPFDLPDALRHLVGVTSYREALKCQKLI